MIDLRGLDIVSDGVPFCRIDLTGISDNLDVVADGVPWIGWQADTSATFILSPYWQNATIQDAI